jgi:hypothetical protein
VYRGRTAAIRGTPRYTSALRHTYTAPGPFQRCRAGVGGRWVGVRWAPPWCSIPCGHRTRSPGRGGIGRQAGLNFKSITHMLHSETLRLPCQAPVRPPSGTGTKGVGCAHQSALGLRLCGPRTAGGTPLRGPGLFFGGHGCNRSSERAPTAGKPARARQSPNRAPSHSVTLCHTHPG